MGDSRKLLSPEHYPSWVVFSQQQNVLYCDLLKNKNKNMCLHILFNSNNVCLWLVVFQLTWLNLQMEEMWPYINEVYLFSINMQAPVLHFSFLFFFWILDG